MVVGSVVGGIGGAIYGETESAVNYLFFSTPQQRNEQNLSISSPRPQ